MLRYLTSVFVVSVSNVAIVQASNVPGASGDDDMNVDSTPSSATIATTRVRRVVCMCACVCL